MLRILLYAVPLILAVYALVDLVQTDEKDVQGLPKLVWVLLIVLVWIVGPVAWLVAGRKGRGIPGLPPRTTDGPSAGPRGRTLAPDDDPDFLRGLNPPKSPPRRPEDDDSAAT
jgi:hypothetical protein